VSKRISRCSSSAPMMDRDLAHRGSGRAPQSDPAFPSASIERITDRR
jgi:hypothetical protein